MQEYLPVSEVAALEGVSPRAIRKRIDRDKYSNIREMASAANGRTEYHIGIDELSNQALRKLGSVADDTSDVTFSDDENSQLSYEKQQLREKIGSKSDVTFFLTVKQVAEYDDVAEVTIRQRIRRDQINPVTVSASSGGRFHFIPLDQCSDQVQLRYWRDQLPRRSFGQVDMIRRDYHLLDLEPDLVEDLLAKQDWMDLILEAPAGMKEHVIGFCCDEFNVHRTTVYRWLRDYQDSEENIRVFIPKARKDKGTRKSFSPEAIDFLTAFYLDGNRKSKKKAYQATVAEAAMRGWDTGSYTSAVRILKERCDSQRALMTYATRGRRGVETEVATPILRRYDDQDPMQLLVGDHAQLNVVVYNDHGKLYRPWITAWQDWRTRAIPGWVLSAQPNGRTIALALRHAILPKPDERNRHFGLPARVYTDNGKDYRGQYLTGSGEWREKRFGSVDSDRAMGLDIQTVGTLRNLKMELGGVYADLDVSTTFAQAYRSWSKPVERWFETLNAQLMCELPGYVGADIGERDDARLYQEQDLDQFLHVAELRELIKEYLAVEYHATDHRTLGQSPDAERAQAERDDEWEPVEMDAGQLDILLLPVAERVVQKTGIALDNILYTHRSQWRYFGETVRLRYDPTDRSFIRVYSADWEYLYTATPAEPLSMDATSEEIAARMADRNAQVRSIIEQYAEMTGGVVKPDNFKKKSFRFNSREAAAEERDTGRQHEDVSPLDLLPEWDRWN